MLTYTAFTTLRERAAADALGGRLEHLSEAGGLCIRCGLRQPLLPLAKLLLPQLAQLLR